MLKTYRWALSDEPIKLGGGGSRMVCGTLE